MFSWQKSSLKTEDWFSSLKRLFEATSGREKWCKEPSLGSRGGGLLLLVLRLSLDLQSGVEVSKELENGPRTTPNHIK